MNIIIDYGNSSYMYRLKTLTKLLNIYFVFRLYYVYLISINRSLFIIRFNIFVNKLTLLHTKLLHIGL